MLRSGSETKAESGATVIRETTWSPKDNPGRREDRPAIQVQSALGDQQSGEMRFMLTEARVNNDLYIEFLKRLLKGVVQPIFLILDGHPVH